MNRVFISLGSNINKEVNLPYAVQLLRENAQVMAMASVYETIPVGLREQPNFFNTAVLILSPLDPPQIKGQLIDQIETKLNRVRLADKNAPRTIDADIALFNEAVMEYVGQDGRSRHLPDPDILKFPHAAVPLAELAPDYCHPETGDPLRSIAARLIASNTVNGKAIIWRRDDIQL